MLGSMYSAVSGLQAHQTKMNVIGNNIANVNTYGFKASRVTFTDVFYQTINGASAPLGEKGGTNPNQMGYGARVNSIDVINTRAGSATTDRALDVYINGDGYIPVRDSSGVTKYTRVGILSFDESGNLVDANGNKVLGFPLDDTTKNASLNADGTIDIGGLTTITIKPEELEKYTGIAIGQNGEITAIKAGDPIVVPSSGTSWMSSVPTVNAEALYSGPVTMSVRQNFTPAGYTGPAENIQISSNADLNATAMGVVYTAPSTYTLNYADSSGTSRTATGTLDSSTTPPTLTFTGVYDKNGGTTATVSIPVVTDATADNSIGYHLPTGTSTTIADIGLPVANSYTVKIQTTNKAGQSVTIEKPWTGSEDSIIFDNPESGQLTVNIDPTKFKTALDAGFKTSVIGNAQAGPGKPEKIAHLANVNFINPDGLTQSGEGYYVESTNSGTPVATIPGNNGTGGFRSGALEMSNVDLSREFTEMIITQRGFQANTRMITVSDEMLSELVNMKR